MCSIGEKDRKHNQETNKIGYLEDINEKEYKAWGEKCRRDRDSELSLPYFVHRIHF